MNDIQPDFPFRIPEKLLWLRQKEAGRTWLDRLPDLFRTARSRFDLDSVGQPFSGGYVSFVLPAKRGPDDVILKLQFVHRESRFEADALRHWNGLGACRLLGHDPEIGAMLLERCRPGSYLAEAPETDQLGVLADLLRKLLVPAGDPFLSLIEESTSWISSLEKDWLNAGKPCERYLVDFAVSALKELNSTETEQVLLHQDLHGHNVLSADREPWLAIDPKPLVGDPAFALSPIVRSFEFGHTREAARFRLDRLSEELALDRERARLWTVGQTMAWAFDSAYSERHFETTRWLMD
ncbi:MAG: aminoglycoside phosphotransferase family protein [Roseibium sp.]|uniref:aminoglycoside phosphotransferase family protein n=1 Tax=Roseibium sp. TaxID=1936156 RepID=UPI0026026FC7|nr:aminoglycoside phosphotransferase family protein [Roseibium sp.]MCV0427102.1 aminoglycoside phosphotransferase family protein [Roseibium sp.]